MGEERRPVPFRKACDIFTTLELDGRQFDGRASVKATAVTGAAKSPSKRKDPEFVSKEQIEADVIKIITENQNIDRETRLSEVGNRLVKLYRILM